MSLTKVSYSMVGGAPFNVFDFGASPNSSAATNSIAIQAAIDAAVLVGGGQVYFPTGTYDISVPIRLYSFVSLIGSNTGGSVISKSTSTVGTGSNLARSGTKIDSYAVDAIVQLIHPDNAYTSYAQIHNLKLKKAIYASSSYGIYSPRANHFSFSNILIENCSVGYYTFDSWMSSLLDVTVQACIIGFQHVDDGSGFGTGTSVTFTTCWVNFDNTVTQPNNGFSFFGLTYSPLIGCGVDNGTRVDGVAAQQYYFNTCRGMSITSCGSENGKGSVLTFYNSSVTVDTFRALTMTGVAAGTSGTIFVDGSKITLTGCTFEATTSPGIIYDWIIQNGSVVYEINPAESPSGGNSFISYSTASSKTVMSNGVITVITSSGSKMAGLIPTTASAGAYFDASSVLTSNGNPIQSNSGSLAATVTPQTVFTVGLGSYYFYAFVPSSGTNYRSVVLVTSDSVTADSTNLKAGTNVLITISGLNIQIALSSGTAQVAWNLIRV